MYGLDDDEDDDDFGTATALKLLKDKIVKDCIVVSSDLICNVNLQLMANFYRINNASIVMLLGNFVEQNLALPVPGSNGKYSPGIAFYKHIFLIYIYIFLINLCLI